MISIPSNWVSLRTKITGLAIIPALVCSIIFGLLIWATSTPPPDWWARS